MDTGERHTTPEKSSLAVPLISFDFRPWSSLLELFFCGLIGCVGSCAAAEVGAVPAFVQLPLLPAAPDLRNMLLGQFARLETSSAFEALAVD